MSEDNKLHEEAKPSASAQHAEAFKVQSCPECGGTRLMRDYECAEIVCMD